ncbi:hypothetical protein AB0M57_14770 [Streptomyces sp. NPDC051597]|uniref:hypothetical protein n=1 Tax=Streptomyces sp. NPDC051597 TaxID=3155049 RepID=UPI0034232C38
MSALDPGYGLEPVGAPGCALCDAWMATREAAREDRAHEEIREANAEITRHPDHHTWPREQALR